MLSLFVAWAMLPQDRSQPIPYNPMAAYFRTSESAYAVLPPRDLGLDNVMSAQVRGHDIVVAVSQRADALDDLETDLGEFDVRLIWVDGKTGRKTNFDANVVSGSDWHLAASSPHYLVIDCLQPEFSSRLVRKRDGRVIPVPEGQVALAATTDRIAVANGETIIVFDGAGNEIRRLPQLPGKVLPVAGGYLFFEASGFTHFEIDHLRATPLERQQIDELMYPEVLGPYIVQFSPELNREDPSAGAPVRIVPNEEATTPTTAESGTPSDRRLPHELPRSVEVSGLVHMAELVGNRLYLVQSRRLFVREIVPVPLDVYRSVILGRIQTEAMMAAKQVATALHIFAADNDDRFPGADWRETLEPYLKNSDLISRFTYAGNGERMDQIENPAETTIGWTDTPYGRAIAYADGSVRWKPSP